MPRYTCPRCQAPIPVPSGPTAGGDTVRLTCPQCGSNYTLRRVEGIGAGPSRGGPSAGTPRPPEGAPSAAPSAPGATPSRIGPYEILQVIGRGGMGVVYKGRDPKLDRWLAVKTLLPSLASDAEARERFLREARAAAALSHPNLTQIYSIGDEDGMPWFAMEFIEGETLAQRLEREERLKPAEAIRIVRQVALGLEEAHRVQLVHRDIKPANLILTRDGTVKISDFGLAKRAQGPAELQLTATGQAIGSPLYMSPEQARGVEVDHRSDIYSLGVTLFHMLAGRPPFQAASAMDIAMKHVQEPAPSPRAFAPDISYPLAGLVQRMLRKRPEDRFPSYRALLHELDRVEAAGRGETAAGQVVPVWVRERRGAPSASFIGFLALCVAAGLMGFRMVRGGLREWRQGYRPAAHGYGRGPGAGKTSAPVGVEGGVRMSGGGNGLSTAPQQGEPRLRVHDMTHVQLSEGLRVHGLVVNEGGGPAQGVQVEVRAYDSSGALVANQLVSPQGATMMVPGESAPFEVFFPQAEGIARVEAHLTWSY